MRQIPYLKLNGLDLIPPCELADGMSAEYRSATPFPHCVIDGLFSDTRLREMLAEWPPPESLVWRHNLKPTGDKWGANEPARLGPKLRQTIEVLNAKPFLRFLAALTGIPKLSADTREQLGGAGLHEMRAGGFLDVHVDFNRMHKQDGPYRRLNVFLFLNDNWGVKDGGSLELWGHHNDMLCPMRKILPTLGRMVIFSTSEHSWHGNPDKVLRADGATRKSIALYYYSPEPPPGWTGKAHGTIYREGEGRG